MMRLKAKALFKTLSLLATQLLISLPVHAQIAQKSPSCLQLAAGQSEQLNITTQGITEDEIYWMVNGIIGGAPAIGTINAQGLYLAPVKQEPTRAQVSAVARHAAQSLLNKSICTSAKQSTGKTYHVKINGSDLNGPGSEQQPWRHIQFAIDQMHAGDTVLVYDGIYNETIRINRSGNLDDGFITLQAAPDSKPIIDGTSLITQPYGMEGLITIRDASYVKVSGFEVRNYISQSDFIAIGVLVTGTGERIELSNNRIHHIEANNPPSKGSANALGIAVYGQSEKSLRQVIVDGNELHDLKTGTSEALTFSGNVEHWQITNNHVHNSNFIGIDATGYYNRNAPDPDKDRARFGWIANNHVHSLNVSDNPAVTYVAAAIGIYVDGARDITIENNKTHNNDGGIWLMSEKEGKVAERIIVRNNLITGNRDAGILAGGYDAHNSGGLTESIIANNTLYHNNLRQTPDIHSGEFQIGYHVNDVKFANNILNVTNKGYAVTRFSPAETANISFSNNIYYSADSDVPLRWFWINQSHQAEQSGDVDTRAFHYISSDNDSSDITDPLFINPALLDFRLDTESPALTGGIYDSRLGIIPSSDKGMDMPPINRGIILKDTSE